VSHQHWKRQLAESTWLTFKYAWDYPNIVPSIGRRLFNCTYNIAAKSLETLIPWSKERIKGMIKWKQWVNSYPPELDIYQNWEVDFVKK
jgi:hypothetical protein